MDKFALLSMVMLAVVLLGCTQPPAASDNASGGFSQLNTSKVVDTMVAKGDAVKAGDTVKVDYVGSTGGKLFDTSLKAEAQKAGLPLRPSYGPLEFKVGAGMVIKGFDNAVIGMKVGDDKTVTFPPEQGYGPVDPRAIVVVPKGKFGDNSSDFKVGIQVMSSQGMPGTITKVEADNVTIDFNHELAGKTLTFRVILREIVKK